MLVKHYPDLFGVLRGSTFSSFYKNAGVAKQAFDRRQSVTQYTEEIVGAFEIKPGMTYKDTISGYKTILFNLLDGDNKVKLYYNLTIIVGLLVFLFTTGNMWGFTNILLALTQLLREGKISIARARIIAALLRSRGVLLPEELEKLIS
jgi:hypothetical protein